jgi:spore maturation protein CgeB
MTDMLVEGKEYIAFTTQEDCLKKIRFYLEHPDILRSIAEASRNRAIRDYSPHCWWSKVFAAVGK